MSQKRKSIALSAQIRIKFDVMMTFTSGNKIQSQNWMYKIHFYLFWKVFHKNWDDKKKVEFIIFHFVSQKVSFVFRRNAANIILRISDY